jgi:hypothetical protein
MTTSSRIFDVVQAMSGQKNVIIIPRPYLQFFGEDQLAYPLAAVLNQIVFWSGVESSCGDGWFYKSHEEMGSDLEVLSPDQIGRLVKKICLKYLPGIIETKTQKVNGTPTTHYRILDSEALMAKIFPKTLDSAKVRNGNREDAESIPQHHGIETAGSQKQCRESAESYLYTDLNSDHNSQIIKPIGQPQAADPQQVDSLKIDYTAVLEAFHTTLPELPGVLKMTDKRRKALRKLWKDYDLNIEKWGAYLRYISKKCRWMLEDRPDTNTGKTWRKKDFDYLIDEECYLKVKEDRANDLPTVARVDNTERDEALYRLVSLGRKPKGRVEELAMIAFGKAGLQRANEVMVRSAWKSIWLQAVSQASEEDLARIAS